MSWSNITTPLSPVIYVQDQNEDFLQTQDGEFVETDVTLPTSTWGNITAPSDSYGDIATPSDTYANMGYNFLVKSTLEFLVTAAGLFLVTAYPIMDWGGILAPSDLWSDI